MKNSKPLTFVCVTIACLAAFYVVQKYRNRHIDPISGFPRLADNEFHSLMEPNEPISAYLAKRWGTSQVELICLNGVRHPLLPGQIIVKSPSQKGGVPQFDIDDYPIFWTADSNQTIMIRISDGEILYRGPAPDYIYKESNDPFPLPRGLGPDAKDSAVEAARK